MQKFKSICSIIALEEKGTYSQNDHGHQTDYQKKRYKKDKSFY